MKKKTPLVILRFVSKWLKIRGDLFTVVDPGEKLFIAIDQEPGTGFKFEISDFKIEGSTVRYLVRRTPSDDKSIGQAASWVEEGAVKGWFDKWISLLAEYDSTESKEDILRQQARAEEIFKKFNVDESQQNEYPTLNQLEIIDGYLETVKQRVLQEDCPLQIEEREVIAEEIESIREKSGSATNGAIMRMVALLYANILKHGPNVLKWIANKGLDELWDVSKQWLQP